MRILLPTFHDYSESNGKYIKQWRHTEQHSKQKHETRITLPYNENWLLKRNKKAASKDICYVNFFADESTGQSLFCVLMAINNEWALR